MASQAAVLIVRAAAGFATLDPEAIPREIAASAPVCLVPLKFTNFPSHRNHIETLNIANDAFMEH